MVAPKRNDRNPAMLCKIIHPIKAGYLQIQGMADP